MKFRRLRFNRYIGRHMIITLRRVLTVSLVAFGSLAVAGPAVLAATAPVLAPYVEVIEDAPKPDVPQWTYRYLIPAVVALTVVLIAGTVIMYFVKVVRGRYTVVE